MSVTFFVTSAHYSVDDEASYLNVTASNAADLLRWLGYANQIVRGLGQRPIELRARDLAARCRRRLWPERRNLDPERPPEVLSGRAVLCGRVAGYLRQRSADLLALAERAGDGTITVV